jgi:hypothetical protein
VSVANSLVGSRTNDQIGFVRPLTNGNYVVWSSLWDNGSVVDAGAAALGNGTTGTAGAVSQANALVGSRLNDRVGGVTALTNGNYVVHSADWDDGTITDAGALTFGNGVTGVTGLITPVNSLIGSTAQDSVGASGILPLGKV